MTVPVVSIIVTIILASLLLWGIEQLVSDDQIRKVARVLIVVLCVLYIIGALTGIGPAISFR